MNVAFIPVRGGSKSIPLKNIRPICGRPLVYWTVKAACLCRFIDKVYVATDSDRIRETVEAFLPENRAFEKVEVIGRSAQSASDTASTESAMLEFAQKFSFDNIVLVQATSPLLAASDLDRGFELFILDDTDSVLSVVRQKRFNWAFNADSTVYPSNYDVFHRPRRQEFDGYLVENGAFYITSRERLLATGNRISGKIRALEMDEDTFFEIDEPSDWLIIEALMKKKGLGEKKPHADIRMFLTDCDGCLTDGGMYYSEKGDELKKFNTRDGKGFGLSSSRGFVLAGFRHHALANELLHPLEDRGHGKPQLLLDEADLFIITGVAHPCDGLAVSRLSGDQAAQQVYLVLVGNGDQKIRLLHACLLLHPVAGGIAVDAHHIQEISHHPNLLLVRVDDRNLVPFLIELLGQNIAHLAAACDNDPHRSVLLPSFF